MYGVFVCYLHNHSSSALTFCFKFHTIQNHHYHHNIYKITLRMIYSLNTYLMKMNLMNSQQRISKVSSFISIQKVEI